MTGKQPRCPAGSEGINKLVSPDDGGKLNRKKKSLSHGNSWRIVSAHRQMRQAHVERPQTLRFWNRAHHGSNEWISLARALAGGRAVKPLCVAP
jgi:hypothetical protein